MLFDRSGIVLDGLDDVRGYGGYTALYADSSPVSHTETNRLSIWADFIDDHDEMMEINLGQRCPKAMAGAFETPILVKIGMLWHTKPYRFLAYADYPPLKMEYHI